MTDDIVTRLRGELVVWLNDKPWMTFDALPVLHEAANEIERLRSAIKSVLVNIDDAHDNVGKYGLCITCDVADGSWPCVHRIVLDELKEAVRNG